MTSPAYAALTCRRPIVWGERRLQPGDVVVDLRFRGGRRDLDTFKSLLKWSAFEFADVAAPAAPAPSIPVVVQDADLLTAAQKRITDLEATLTASVTAQRQRIEELEAALAAAHAPAGNDAGPGELLEAPVEPRLALLLKRIKADELTSLTGLKTPAAKALKAWADSYAVTAPADEA